jgi:hypothetical protein
MRRSFSIFLGGFAAVSVEMPPELSRVLHETVLNPAAYLRLRRSGGQARPRWSWRHEYVRRWIKMVRHAMGQEPEQRRRKNSNTTFPRKGAQSGFAGRSGAPLAVAEGAVPTAPRRPNASVIGGAFYVSDCLPILRNETAGGRNQPHSLNLLLSTPLRRTVAVRGAQPGRPGLPRSEADISRVVRDPNGQQNAHRCIAPGGNSGGGAPR